MAQMHGITQFLAALVTALRRSWVSAILAAAILALTASPGRGAGPLTLEGSLPLGIRAYALVLDGNLAYVATEKGLTIVDVSDPLRPAVRGAMPSFKRTRSGGVGKKGAYVYRAAGRAGMQVIDVSNPSAPRTIASAFAGGNIYDVAVHPTAAAAYAASYRGQVQVWDIANPAAPRLAQKLGVLSMRLGDGASLQPMRDLREKGTAYVTGVSAAGRYVFAGDWNYGSLYAWDSSDPLHLTFAGSHQTLCLYRTAADPTRDVVYMLVTWARWSGVYTLPLSMLDPFVLTSWETCTACGVQPAGLYMDGG